MLPMAGGDWREKEVSSIENRFFKQAIVPPKVSLGNGLKDSVRDKVDDRHDPRTW